MNIKYIVIGVAYLVTVTAQANVIVAGWDEFHDFSAGSGAAQQVAAGVIGLVSGGSFEDGVHVNTWLANTSRYNNDGKFGAVFDGASVTGTAWEIITPNTVNSTAYMEFEITNNGNEIYELSYFSFDAVRLWNALDSYTLRLVAGDLGVSTLGSGSFSNSSFNNYPTDYEDFDIPLAGLTLEPGQSATFRLDFDDVDLIWENRLYIDNVGIIGVRLSNSINPIGTVADRIKAPGIANHALNFHQSGQTAWESIAPGFVNVPVEVVIQGDVITMSIDIGGLMQSRDRGQTWKTLTYHSPGGITAKQITGFDIHPTNDQLIVTGGDRIYRTEDGGTSWHEVNYGIPEPLWLSTASMFSQIKFSRSGNTLYAGMGFKTFQDSSGWERFLYDNNTDKSIYVSYDDGRSWNEKVIEAGNFSVIRRIYFHPTLADIAYVSFADGTFYLIQNAEDDNISFSQISIPSGLFVRDMSISTTDPNTMMLTMTSIASTNRAAYLYRGTTSTLPSMTLVEVPVIGTGVLKRDFWSIGYNPSQPNQLVIGNYSDKNLLISEDGAASFNIVPLPSQFYTGYKLSSFYGNIERVWFGSNGEDYAVIASRIGSWITFDNFATFQDLTMSEEDGYIGNKGVGSPANINGVAIGKEHIYFNAQDHGAFRSKGGDHTMWKSLTFAADHPYIPTQTTPWGQLSWFLMTEKLFTSYDEKYVYINAISYADYYLNGKGFAGSKKIFQSKNQGDLWIDITPKFGKGDVYPSGSIFVKVLFNPQNSDQQWFLFSNTLYYTANGGETFSEISSSLFPDFKPNWKDDKIGFTDIAYDQKNNIMYLSVGHRSTQMWAINLSTNIKPASLYKSVNGGADWTIMDVGQNDIQSLGVKADGTLFIGTGRAGSVPARLIVLPFEAPYNSAHIKMTLGDAPYEIAANQLRFAHIKVSGNDVLVYSDIKWVVSDRFYAQGPYLSRNGGETFEFIQRDLPNNNIYSLDMKNGVIVIGTIFGLMRQALNNDVIFYNGFEYGFEYDVIFYNGFE